MKAWVMGAELVAQESWLCWEEGDGFVTCTHGLGGPCYGGWCYGGRGAAEDGAAEDGAKEDGAAEDAVSGTHGLGGPCYGRRCYEDGATEVGATEDGATEVAVIGTHGLGGPCYGGWLRRTVLRWMVQRWVGASTKKPAKHKGLRVSDGCRFLS